MIVSIPDRPESLFLLYPAFLSTTATTVVPYPTALSKSMQALKEF
jgi:hypothetical protein